MPQSLSSIALHLIFSTKHRHPFITPDISRPLHAFLGSVFQARGCTPVRINGGADHVHCLFFLARTVPACEVVERVKRESSKWRKTQGAPYHGFAWQEGYGVFSVSASDLGRVKAYLDDQEARHQTRTFQDEFRAFLERYQVAYDERYVWD